jgi:hypothetical protein
VLLQHFWLGLNKESALLLDTAAGGSFTHKTTEEGEALLDRILENTPPLEPIRVEPEPCHEDASSAETEITPPSETPSPEPHIPKESLSGLPYFDYNFHDDFGNYSKYDKKNINRVQVTLDIDRDFIKESVKEMTAIMSKEWTEERESSSEAIQIGPLTRSMQCQVQDEWVEALYNPTVGANLMSTTYACTRLGDRIISPTTLLLKNGPSSHLEGQGVIHNVHVKHEGVVVILDFHIFDNTSFDVLIGRPMEKFFYEALDTGELSVKIGRGKFSIPFSRAKNSIAEPSCPSMPEEVMSVSPFESPESSLDKDADLFIEEEDDSGEILELPKEEVSPPPPIELKTLPEGLRYVFLHDNQNTPVIISDKLSDEETSKLVAVLEKRRSVFGYSLKDLKGVSPTLCTHRIPIDPASTPSREP